MLNQAVTQPNSCRKLPKFPDEPKLIGGAINVTKSSNYDWYQIKNNEVSTLSSYPSPARPTTGKERKGVTPMEQLNRIQIRKSMYRNSTPKLDQFKRKR